MALLKIARMGHPVLAHPAEPVANPADPEVQRLAASMVETMIDADGVGLAAPQVYESRRIIVFEIDSERAEAEELPAPQETTVLINPEIEVLDPTEVEGIEGCLSIPGLVGLVPRFRAIRYRGLALDGAPVESEAEDFLARVIQHEVDHLNGILFTQRMRDMSKLVFQDELRHLTAAAAEDTSSA